MAEEDRNQSKMEILHVTPSSSYCHELSISVEEKLLEVLRDMHSLVVLVKLRYGLVPTSILHCRSPYHIRGLSCFYDILLSCSRVTE